jgi:hypothetical protein
VLVGRVVAEVPDAAGRLTLELTCRAGDAHADNRYDARIDA